ncbi:MAG: hypothetical protein DRP18_03995 [Candidatus Aenigmatarchaeota archaeon]|nr:MAG: hypothetical protein DRP18_03995 [Candidatus Aenigmarchaeota archaeon]
MYVLCPYKQLYLVTQNPAHILRYVVLSVLVYNRLMGCLMAVLLGLILSHSVPEFLDNRFYIS